MIPNDPSAWYREQSLNRVIVLNEFVRRVPAIFESLLGARSELLMRVRSFCDPANLLPVKELISAVIEPGFGFAKGALDLRTQRNYAIKVSRYLLVVLGTDVAVWTRWYDGYCTTSIQRSTRRCI